MSALRQHHDAILDVDQAAAKLGLSAYTVRQWARERKLPAIRLGKFWRFRESSLDQWMADRERPAR